MALAALKYDVEVMEKGRAELNVPFPKGSKVTVFVVNDSTDTLDDLFLASQSSLDFWNNHLDDEDWNNA
jgi:hypothetical protein